MTSQNLSRLKNVKPLRLYIAGTVFLLIALLAWCYNLNNDPQKVFERMLSQSLSTSGVTINTKQENNGATIDQNLQYSLGANNISRTFTTINQKDTKVATETIGTSTADFTRYATIKTTRKGQNGKPLNVSKLVGVWAKSDQSQLFTQATLGTGLPIGGIVVPVANLTPNLRNQLLDQIKADNVYQTDYSKAKKQKNNGRTQFVYDVTMKPVSYARLMKTFAKSLGIHDLDSLNPTEYANQQPLQLTITVDAKANHAVEAALPAGQYKQTYSSYDVPVNVKLPTQTISSAELQKRLSEVK
jgi:hypothetical protein